MVTLWLSKPHETFIFPLPLHKVFFDSWLPWLYRSALLQPSWQLFLWSVVVTQTLPAGALFKRRNPKQKDLKQTNSQVSSKINDDVFILFLRNCEINFFLSEKVHYHGLFWFAFICFHRKSETNINLFNQAHFFLIICPPLELLPLLGPWQQWVPPTLDASLLCSSTAGSDLGLESGLSSTLICCVFWKASRCWAHQEASQNDCLDYFQLFFLFLHLFSSFQMKNIEKELKNCVLVTLYLNTKSHLKSSFQ